MFSRHYIELKGLLSEEGYAAARAITLNAHYTSPTVIRAIYDAVERMGFRSGNILEPSMGVGNFFGMLPEGMQASRLYGVELDSITGRIAKQLYPNASITVAGLQKLPSVKALNAEYAELLAKKKSTYSDYRAAREEMQELLRAQKNVELFFRKEKEENAKQIKYR